MIDRPFSVATIALAGATPAMLAALQPSAETLARFGVPFVERSPAEALLGGPRAVIIACENGTLAAELAIGEALVIRVPVGGEEPTPALDLLTGYQAWPTGPSSFATMAIGEAGARNAALLAISILALDDQRLRALWEAFRVEQTAVVLREPPFRA